MEKEYTLLISPFFFPEPISTGKYNALLAHALADAGEKVLVCCSHPLYPDWTPQPSDEQIPGIEILRGGHWVRYPNSIPLRRLILELWFSFHAVRSTGKYWRKCRRVVAVFPPSLFFYLLRLFLPKSTICIGVVHDLQGLLGLSGGGWTKRFFAKLVSHVEAIGFNACDKLILLSEGMKSKVVNDYGIPPDLCSVHYPFASNIRRKEPEGNLQSVFPAGYRHVVYSGAIGIKQNPSNLLALFEELARSRTDVICHFFSRGPAFERLQNAVAQDIRDRVLFHDLVAESDLPEVYARSSVQIIPQKSGTSDGAFPSKLPNLITAGVPVFAITDEGSELQKLLDESGLYPSMSTWELSELVPALSSLLDTAAATSHSERAERLAPFVARHFSLQALVDEILSAKISVGEANTLPA